MPAPGDLLNDRYRILAPLGAGGMATVHRARDERLGREVAVKVLLPNLAGDPVTAQRFEREARAMAAVAHPGLVAVFDVDAGDPAAGHEPFVVMELCPGGSLADRLGPNRPMPADELIPILVAIADALAALHGAGLVHRDVKPSNILFATDRVKLADFGLVRSGAGATDDDGELTESGTAIGTLAYLAPERLRGDPGGPPADIFALATIAHLGLTGSLPRPAGSVRDVVAAAPFRAPPVSSVAPALGPAFDAPILEALAVDPARRPDAVTFGSRLAAALGVWTRSGRPGAPTEDHRAEPWLGTASAAGSSPDRGEDDDPTTAIAIPTGPTDRLELPAPAPPRVPGGRVEPDAPATRTRRSLVPLVLAGLLGLAAVVLLAVAFGPRPGSVISSSPSPPAPRASAVASASSPASASTAASEATPAPSADPAIAALRDVDSAIAAARGGKDGLKGKEANDLLGLAGRVEDALDAGDRPAAREAARDLDQRARKLADRMGREAAERLVSATAALVAALGG